MIMRGRKRIMVCRGGSCPSRLPWAANAKIGAIIDRPQRTDPTRGNGQSRTPVPTMPTNIFHSPPCGPLNMAVNIISLQNIISAQGTVLCARLQQGCVIARSEATWRSHTQAQGMDFVFIDSGQYWRLPRQCAHWLAMTQRFFTFCIPLRGGSKPPPYICIFRYIFCA